MSVILGTECTRRLEKAVTQAAGQSQSDHTATVGKTGEQNCRSTFEVVLFRAAFFLAFFRAFRCSELVAAATDDASGRALSRADITLGQRELRITLRRSKTDQQAQGVHVIVHTGPGRAPCLVRSLKEYLAIRPDQQGMLLLHENGACLSRYQFISVFRACLKKASYPTGQLGDTPFGSGQPHKPMKWGFPLKR